jgi:DNA-binding response OmpR family regulator
MTQAKYRILIAEDEPAIAKLIEFKLSKEGFEVVVARDGGEASAQLKNGKWALIILDVMMPVKSGWDVLREMRNIEGMDQLPVIVLSGKAEDSIGGPVPIGNTRRLAKPFAPESLVQAIREMVAGQ